MPRETARTPRASSHICTACAGPDEDHNPDTAARVSDVLRGIAADAPATPTGAIARNRQPGDSLGTISASARASAS